MNNTPLESEVQIAIVQYLEILERQGKVLWFTGSGNGQFQKSIGVKMKMKREGIRAGMPDLTIVFPDNLVFIELKREKGGEATPEQLNAIKKINMMGDKSGVVAGFIAYGFGEAKAIIDRFVNT